MPTPSTAHHQDCVWMLFFHPPLLGSLSPSPSILYPFSTLYHPLPSQCPPTIPFTTQQFRQKLSLPTLASPANHRNGFWAGSHVPSTTLQKTEATGSHQPTYIPTYAYTYLRTRSKTDNVRCMISESSIFMCCTAYTAPTYVCTLDGVPSIECSKHNVVSQHQLMLYEWYNRVL